MERIRQFLAQKLGFGSSNADRRQVLDSVDFDGVMRYIREGRCRHVITMAGAGLSTSAGIPDFRSPGTGLYDNLAKYNLPYPEAVFDSAFFDKNPKPFFVLAKQLYPEQLKPTVAHRFIRLLDEKGLLLRHYTQNIDTLERVAGLSPDKLLEAHGTFHTSHCTQCRKLHRLDWMKAEIFSDRVPSCTDCGAVVKPDIVFFGDDLPSRFFSLVMSDFRQCDLLIVLGTSLVVQPFAALVDRVSETCPRLIINKDKSSRPNFFMRMVGFSGINPESSTNYRDVMWLGTCDDGAREIAKALEWEDDLDRMIEEGGSSSRTDMFPTVR